MPTSHMTRFETFLENIHHGGQGDLFRTALVEVADTASACKVWFESHGLSATAADIMAMTRLVMERGAALKAAEDAANEVGTPLRRRSMP